MSKILIYTVSYGIPTPDYISLSCLINKQYSDAHSYEFQEFVLDDDFPRNPAWGRVWYLKEKLKDYDYMFYIDGDAFFVNQAVTLNSLMEYMEDPFVCGLFARDQMLKDRTFHIDRANAGVFLWKRENDGVKLAQDWWDVPNDKSYDGTFYDALRYLDHSDSLYHHPYEQLALWFLWVRNSRSFRFVKDYKELNGLDGNFVRHLLKIPNNERCRIMDGFSKGLKKSM